MPLGTTRSLGQRLSWLLALQSLAGLACVSTIVFVVTTIGFEARQSDALLQKEQQLKHLLSEVAGGIDAEQFRHKLDDVLIGRQDIAIRLARADGTEFFVKSPELFGLNASRTLETTVEVPGLEGAPLKASLVLDTTEDRRLLRMIGLTLLLAAIGGTALTSLSGYLLVRLGLRPVRELAEQARQLSADTLHRKLDGSAQPDELEPLIAQFNGLLSRLSRAYEQLEGFNADVAHELCTPLATLIGSTEVALRRGRSADELREVLETNLEDLQRMSAIIQDMLFLSQSDRGAVARRVKVESLAEIARHVAEYHEAAFEESNVNLLVEGDAQGAVDSSLVQRAVSNLLSNAVRYAGSGSTVLIRIMSTTGEITLEVINRGVAIKPADLPRLFDRFFRADPSRSDAANNHGLGLAIVAAIARMHGGRPVAASSGGLTSIGMILPRGESGDKGLAEAVNDKTVMQGLRS